MEKGRSSLFTDAIRYASEDFGVNFVPSSDNFILEYQKNDETIVTSNKNVVKAVLKRNRIESLIQNSTTSTWQGVMFGAQYNDSDLVPDSCFTWLSAWKDAPVKVVNDFHSIYLQIVSTLTFHKYRGQPNISTTLWRLCKKGEETVRHLLSNCEKFAETSDKRRHDRVLQFIIFKFLHKNDLIENVPPWYTNICIKPHYSSTDLDIYWDIPEYSGYESEQEQNHRP